MSERKFQPGDIVDITIKGVCVVPSVLPPRDGRDLVSIRDEHGDCWPMPPQAAITRVAPAEWPPRPGDLWRGHGGPLWFARSNGRMVPDIEESASETAENVLAYYGSLNLVHREQQDEPAESLSEGWPPRPGDLWRDRNGAPWYTVDWYHSGPTPRLASYQGDSAVLLPDAITGAGWTLVHREQHGDLPEGWPPRLGDVWADDDGDQWTATHDAAAGVVLAFEPVGELPPAEWLRRFGTAHCVRLVSRRGQDGEQQS